MIVSKLISIAIEKVVLYIFANNSIVMSIHFFIYSIFKVIFFAKEYQVKSKQKTLQSHYGFIEDYRWYCDRVWLSTGIKQSKTLGYLKVL